MSMIEWVIPVPDKFKNVIFCLPDMTSVERFINLQSGFSTAFHKDKVERYRGVTVVDSNGSVICEAAGFNTSYVREEKSTGAFVGRAHGNDKDEHLVIFGEQWTSYVDENDILVITLEEITLKNTTKGNQQMASVAQNTIVAPSLTPTALQSMLFRPVNDVVFDVMAGAFGIRTESGIATMSSVKTGSGAAAKVEYSIEQNPLDLSMAMPGFAMRVAPEAVKPGDIMYIGNKPTFVTEVRGKKVSSLSTEGVEVTVNMPVNKLFGAPGVMICKNLFEGVMGGTGDNPMSALAPIMMMQMMSGQNSGAGGDMNGMFQQMMLMQVVQGMFAKK